MEGWDGAVHEIETDHWLVATESWPGLLVEVWRAYDDWGRQGGDNWRFVFEVCTRSGTHLPKAKAALLRSNPCDSVVWLTLQAG